MARVLFLCHRLPYPPDKGDKIHTFHVLEHLRARHEVLLGTFCDDPADEVHIPKLRTLCADVHVSRIDTRLGRLPALRGLATREPLSVAFYRDGALRAWVERVARERRADAAFVYSSSMLQFVDGLDLPMMIDFADVDSAKWADYAKAHRWPLSWVYAREARLLLEVERAGAARARWSVFATENEVRLFQGLAPESAGRAAVLGNGVDADFFEPAAGRATPYAAGEIPLVFMGAMDYWPNVDAVVWFATEMLPRLRTKFPALRFHVVGRNPAPQVQALAGPDVNITGTVPDVRPWVQHAAVVVAPLRLARGIQNKVLEAMAMARPVVAAAPCVEAIDARPGAELVAAAEPGDYVREIEALLADPVRAATLGSAARRRVIDSYSWPARLHVLDRQLADVLGAAATPAKTVGAFA